MSKPKDSNFSLKPYHTNIIEESKRFILSDEKDDFNRSLSNSPKKLTALNPEMKQIKEINKKILEIEKTFRLFTKHNITF